MAKRLAFLVNAERCVGCNACELACKNEYQLDPAIRWRKVYEIQEDAYSMPVRIHMSLSCNHCEEPECLRACPVRAYTKHEDGIVLHHQERCIGCGMCIMACPYKVPQYNDLYKRVEKCHMCVDKQDKGEKPSCVSGCPMEALSIIDLNDFPQYNIENKLPGYPDPSITKSTTRFVKPQTGVQIRRDE